MNWEKVLSNFLLRYTFYGLPFIAQTAILEPRRRLDVNRRYKSLGDLRERDT